MDTPSNELAAKMFDIVDAYMASTRQTGWTWKSAIKYIQDHWNDPDFNVDYNKVLELEQSYE